jgi:hypothetical protein
LLLALDELPLGKAATEGVEAMLPLPSRLELAGDPPNARLEPVFAFGELALALGHLTSRLAQSALRLGEIVERYLAGTSGPLECLAIQFRRGLRRPGAARLPSHSSPRATLAPVL